MARVSGRAALAEIERHLTRVARRHPAARRAFLAKYFSTAYPVHGLTVPEQRRLCRAGFSFSDLKAREQFAI